MNQLITIRGNLAADPKSKMLPDGITEAVEFRVASTERRFDRQTESWIDINTSWFTVNCYRGLARNARRSLSKGHPVVVTGKLSVRNWKTKEPDGDVPKTGTTVQIEADSVGHDLSRGWTDFVRTGVEGESLQRAPRAETSEDSTRVDFGESSASWASARSGDDLTPQRVPDPVPHDDDAAAAMYAMAGDHDLVRH
ncbi:single-stranded DNA-binding protein [Citricoccus sp. NR2]|uniref:single-stranded DNA-binding protein n=1 Tax=Citricoccus sp. NR2 TaxID=3004095 RepID=UPI0022DDBA54|nr:single-stranded DNA-binding protein [Citricoccus sp. NR2]WBL18430.1 single-stranded DNA-binding protein [Citricoccus sp. NR2]